MSQPSGTMVEEKDRRGAPHEPHGSTPRVPNPHEFTLRAVIVAIGVAIVIGASYPYMVLKLGFGPNISVVSAFFGYLALGLFTLVLGALGMKVRLSNRFENNIVQTAGTAAGQTAFMCVVMAAFDLLAREPGLGFTLSLTPLQSFLWLSTAGVLGVFLAVPMRQHFVIDEKLPYADGIAAGETLIVLDSRGPDARRAALSMVIALVVSAVTWLLTSYGKLRETLAIAFNRFSGVTGVGLSISWLNLGSGMIIGLRITTSMMLGAIASWVVAPVLLFQNGIIAAGAKKTDILLWVMWPATGMLVAGGLTALFLKWRILSKSFKAISGARVEPTDFPMRWVVIGSIASSLALIAVQYFSLGQSPWLTILAIVFTLPLMLVSLRVLGETNWGPISALSNLMQGVFGLIAPGNVPANMVASGVTGSIVAESEGLIQDYKTGYMIGSTPRFLTYMQLLAVPVGAAAVSLAYPSLRDTYGLGGEHGLQSPISQKWVGFAKILSKGVDALPRSALYALVIGIALGIVLTILEQKKEWRNFVPSPTGVGIGMLVPASAVATMFAGGVTEFVWKRLGPKSAEHYLVPLASGLIAGEALIAVIVAIAINLGWLPAVAS